MLTVSFRPAVPCAPVTVVVPFIGIVAVMLPAGGNGGGIVFKLLKCDVTACPSERPTKSWRLEATVTVYRTFGSSGAVGRKVSVVPFWDQEKDPTTKELSGAVSVAAAWGLLTSIGREKV